MNTKNNKNNKNPGPGRPMLAIPFPKRKRFTIQDVVENAAKRKISVSALTVRNRLNAMAAGRKPQVEITAVPMGGRGHPTHFFSLTKFALAA